MELVTNIIIEYLKHNKRIVVPKLGAFIVKRPEGRVIFSELMRGDDNTLRSLLVAYGMSDIEANGRIDRLVFEIRHAVGSGNSFTIENFGVFYAGENNNILFKQKREAMTFGGNIRPPFEQLNEAKRKMQRARTIDGEPVATKRSASVAKPRSAKRDDEELVNINKPESYLRGLRYENKKSKGHDDDYYHNDGLFNRNRRAIVVVLVVALVVAVAALMWYLLSDDDTSQGKQSAEVAVVERKQVDKSSQRVVEADSVDVVVADSLNMNL